MAGCGRILATGQWWNFCGETDMGQTAPVLCEKCEAGGLKIEIPERFMRGYDESAKSRKQ